MASSAFFASLKGITTNNIQYLHPICPPFYIFCHIWDTDTLIFSAKNIRRVKKIVQPYQQPKRMHLLRHRSPHTLQNLSTSIRVMPFTPCLLQRKFNFIKSTHFHHFSTLFGSCVEWHYKLHLVHLHQTFRSCFIERG